MAISKRLRYEVFRRDNHACRYCGGVAPEVKLTIDHVIPEALGGTDEPANLVAACADCNGGKSSVPPDAPRVADVAHDALRWSAAMVRAADLALADLDRRQVVYDEFEDDWSKWGRGEGVSRVTVPLPSDWHATIDRFIAAGMPAVLLRSYIPIAMGANHVDLEKRFNYLCGIAWNKVGQLQATAHRILGAEDADPGDEPGDGGWLDYHFDLLTNEFNALVESVEKFIWEHSTSDLAFEQVRRDKVKNTDPYGPELGRVEMLKEMMLLLPPLEREYVRTREPEDA